MCSFRHPSQKCSVENPPSSEDHYIQRDGSQECFAALAPITAGSQSGTHQPLEHTVDGFCLPALRIAREVETLSHLPPPVTTRRFVRTPTNQGRDQRPHPALGSGKFVRVFRVVARIERRGLNLDLPQALIQHRPEVLDVWSRPALGHHGQDQMAGRITQYARLGKRVVGRLLPVFAATGAAFHEVVADVMRLPTGAVTGGQGNPWLDSAGGLGQPYRLAQ